jgi:hypothetical protein
MKLDKLTSFISFFLEEKKEISLELKYDDEKKPSNCFIYLSDRNAKHFFNRKKKVLRAIKCFIRYAFRNPSLDVFVAVKKFD